jgi:hypothetical protein
MAQHEGRSLRVAVVGGSGPSAERTFVSGTVSGPLSFGRQGDWAFEGRGVGALDGFLYFDGHELFACSRDAASPVMLDGRPLGTTWERVPMGALLIVGRTRLLVEDPTPAPDSSSTILTDLDAMRAPPAPVVAAVAPTAPSVGMFSSDEEHTRIGELASSAALDSDDAPTAFLSSSVRDAVREGLAREPARAPAPHALRAPASPPRRASAPPPDPGPTHVLRVDARRSSAPPPAQPSVLDTGPFFQGVAPSGVVPLDVQSLPRLSSSMPLYGVSAQGQGPRTEPPHAGAGGASASGAGSLRRLWAEASPVRKATLALLPIALAGFGFVMLTPSPEPARARGPAAGAPPPSAAASGPPQGPPHGAASPEVDAVTPRLIGASTGLAKAPDGGVTLERRAADAVHAHRLDEAAALYKELRAAEPRNAAFGAAAEVLARGASSPR